MTNLDKELNQEEIVEEAGNEEIITMTREEYEMELQRESDRRVSKAIATREDTLKKEIMAELKDYEKKSQMTPEQLKELELEEERAEIQRIREDIMKERAEINIQNKLIEKGMSPLLVDFVYDADEDKANQKMATLEQLILGMVNEEVEKRIGSTKPKASINTEGMDKDTFSKLSIEEMTELYRKDPELYKKLNG